MATVITAKPASMPNKMKKPVINVQTNAMNKPGPPSASPSSSVKRLPVATQPQSGPTVAESITNGAARPNRRLQRISTRVSTSDPLSTDKRMAWPVEPFVSSERHILQKFKNKPPSLVVHLHPSYFRFDQQEGNFSYQSEMRIFIEHLAKKTVPHDMLEEFRKNDVRFYDGWLIVKVIDHRSIAMENTTTTTVEEEKPFSIHNYNQYITPSPCVPHSVREQPGYDEPAKQTKAQVQVYMRALRPTNMSRHIDLMLDFLAVDPKAKRSQKDSRSSVNIPSTPIGAVPPTPSADRPPPFKRQKLRIEPKDHLEYEAKTINGTAPPLYLNPVTDETEMIQVHALLADSFCTEVPPSPKSRQRTTAELAADDAAAKQQERFMLIMDAKTSGSTNNNAGGLDAQAGNVPFQPRFERFNALDTIKREIDEKKRQDEERQSREDEHRRFQQQQHSEEEKRRAAQATIAERKQQAIRQQQFQQQQRQNAEALALAQQQQPQLPVQRPNTASRPQPNGIPPQMQSQMVAPTSSPVIRQGTPHAISSPAQSNGQPMIRNGSRTGAGSPPRPASSLQHAHPAAQSMMRQASGQGGLSRNGTPQISHNTPGMPNATPILRQGTPGHPMTQASPAAQMQIPTPQMTTPMMQGQMPDGQRVPTPQQMAEMQRRQQQQAFQQTTMQMQNGQPLTQQQIAAHTAHSQAILDRNVAINQRRAAQAAMQGTPQPQHASSPAQGNQQAYKGQMAEQMKQRMQAMANGQAHGSSVQQPQLTAQQMQQIRLQQMQGRPVQQQGQPQMNPQAQVQSLTHKLVLQYMNSQAENYGGSENIPDNVKQQIMMFAQNQAKNAVMQQRNPAMMQQMQQQAQQQQQQIQQAGSNFVPQNPQQAAVMQQMLQQKQANMAAVQGNQPNQQQQQQQMTPQLMAQIQARQAAAQQQQQQMQLANAQQRVQANYQAQMAQVQQQVAHMQQQQQAQQQGQNGGQQGGMPG